MALTWPGLALPFVAAITLPTSELNAFSLPARYSATMAGLAAITSSTIFSIAPASEICLQALRPMIASALAFAGPHGVEDFLGDLAGDGAVGDALQQRAQLRGADRRMRDLDLRRVQRGGDLAQEPVGGAPSASAAGRDHRLEIGGDVAVRGERGRVARAAARGRARSAAASPRAIPAVARARARSTPGRWPAAAGPGRGSSGSPARLPCCASSASRAGRDRTGASPARPCRRPRSARSAGAPRTRSPPA